MGRLLIASVLCRLICQITLIRLRTIPLWAFRILGQGCSSQGMDFFLWKVVEKSLERWTNIEVKS
jgi:hypothetical protein